MPPLNKHNLIIDEFLHVCKGHITAQNGDHITRDERGQQLWEKRLVLYPAIDQAEPNAAPPTEDEGDIYVIAQTGITLSVDIIEWQSATTVKYLMTGDISMLLLAAIDDYITITEATNAKHNGTFKITALDSGVGWVEISNPLITSSSDDEAAATARATTTHADWDGAVTNEWIRYNSEDDLWNGIEPVEGVEVFDKSIDSFIVFNGTSWTTSTSPAASETAAGIAEIVTQAETNAGVDDARIVTPLKLATWWTAIKAAVASITETWSFTSEKIRVVASGSSFWAAFKFNGGANQNWTIPDEGDQTFASRSYADSLVVGLWDDRGNFDASVNAYPSSGGSGTAGAINKGDIWTTSVAGTLPTGVVVAPGDTIRALADSPGNTQANWAVAENNFGFTPENVVNKDTDGTLAANSDTNYASQKATKTYADGKVIDSIADSDTTHAPSRNAVYDGLALKEDVANKDTDGTLAANSDAKYASQKATKTYADTKEASANKDTSGGYVGLSGWSIKLRNLANSFTSLIQSVTTAARTYIFPDKDITVAGIEDLQPGVFIMKSGAFITTAVAAGTYHLSQQNNVGISSGTFSTAAPNMVNILAASYPSVTGKTKKLRVKAICGVNATAPGVTFTVGVNPTTAAGGVSGGVAYTIGTVVAGSTVVFTTPGATSLTATTGSSFTFPADGIYEMSVATGGTTAIGSGTHIQAILEVIYE